VSKRRLGGTKLLTSAGIRGKRNRVSGGKEGGGGPFFRVQAKIRFFTGGGRASALEFGGKGEKGETVASADTGGGKREWGEDRVRAKDFCGESLSSGLAGGTVLHQERGHVFWGGM